MKAIEILFVILFLLLPHLATAQTKTQTVSVNVSWAAGNVAGHTGWKVFSCTGVNCTPTVEVGQTAANTLAFSQTITNDVGNVTRGYAVRGFNVDGSTALGPVGYGVSPAIANPPSGTPGITTVTTVTSTGPTP